jgi:hypothetical protein
LLQELTFEVGPSVEPKQLQVALYAVKDDAEAGTAEAVAGNQDEGEEQAGARMTDEFIASGRCGGGKDSLWHAKRVVYDQFAILPSSAAYPCAHWAVGRWWG